MPNGNFVICITHKIPVIPRRLFDATITLGDYGIDESTHISKLDTFWHQARSLSYSAAGSYAIEQALQTLKVNASIIGIVSFRKILSQAPIGIAAPAFNAVREVSLERLIDLPSGSTFPIPPHKFLISTPVKFEDGVIGQYARAHHIVDLFDYLSLAREMSIVNDKDLRDFATSKHLVIGGCEFGHFPRDWLLPTLQSLSILGKEFLSRFSDRLRMYDNHQIRALSFLSERLGSFLLLKHLSDTYGKNIDRGIFGHMSVVVNGDHYIHNEASDGDRNQVICKV